MGQAIANWPTTLRVASLIALAVVLLFGVLWLMPLNLVLGLIEISQPRPAGDHPFVIPLSGNSSGRLSGGLSGAVRTLLPDSYIRDKGTTT